MATMAANAISSLSPATSLRLLPYNIIRLLSLFHSRRPLCPTPQRRRLFCCSAAEAVETNNWDGGVADPTRQVSSCATDCSGVVAAELGSLRKGLGFPRLRVARMAG